MQNHTAGSPMYGNIKWTNLTPKETSLHIIKQLLKIQRFLKRQAQN